MKKNFMEKRVMKTISLIMITMLCFGLMAACGVSTAHASEGGKLLLKVNPQIEVTYDKNGMVEEVVGVNDDGKAVVKDYTGFKGRPCKEVMSELVGKIKAAGYFVEEVEGQGKKITVEVESGSTEPQTDFLAEVIKAINAYIDSEAMLNDIVVEGEDIFELDDMDDLDDLYDADDDEDDIDDDADDDRDDIDDDVDDDRDDIDDDADDDRDDIDDDADDDSDDIDEDKDDDVDDIDDIDDDDDKNEVDDEDDDK